MKRLRIALFVLVAVVGATCAKLSTDLYRLAETRAQIETSVARINALALDVSVSMGFGGFIHNFKNAVLRPTEKSRYLEAFRNDSKTLLNDLQAIEGEYPILKPHLDQIRAVVQRYSDQADFLASTELVDPAQIDAIVRVSDDAALLSMQQIFDRMQSSSVAQLSAIPERENQILGILVGFVILLLALLVFLLRLQSTAAALAEVNQLSSELLENAGAAVIKLDRNGFLDFANTAARRQFGALIGQEHQRPLDHFLAIFPNRPEDDPLRLAFSRVAVTDQIGEYVFPDDKARIIRVVSVPVTAGPTAPFWLIELRDITTTAAAELAVARNLNLVALGQVASGIVHDFRNTLATIKFSLEALQAKFSKTPPSKLWNGANLAIDHGNQLVDRLLDIATQSHPQGTPIRLADTMQSVEMLVSRQTVGDIPLVISPIPDDAVVYGQHGALVAAITNLVLNAKNALISANATNGQVQVSVQEATAIFGLKGWSISVEDNGPGFSQAILQQHDDLSFRKTEHGFGIGLSVVKAVAMDMAGHIQLNNKDSGGAIVTMVLPAYSPQPDAAYNVAVSTARVLILDGDPIHAKALVEGLNKICTTPLLYTDAQALHDALPTLTYDLLLCDIDNLGGISGYEIVQKAKRFHPKATVVIYTSFPVSTLGGLASLGATIISKRASPDNLQVEIRRQLDKME